MPVFKVMSSAPPRQVHPLHFMMHVTMTLCSPCLTSEHPQASTPWCKNGGRRIYGTRGRDILSHGSSLRWRLPLGDLIVTVTNVFPVARIGNTNLGFTLQHSLKPPGLLINVLALSLDTIVWSPGFSPGLN